MTDHVSPWPARRAVLKQASYYVCIGVLASFIIPMAFILYPDLERTYIHAWRVVLGADPDCKYPAAVRPLFGLPDCRETDKATPTRIIPKLTP